MVSEVLVSKVMTKKQNVWIVPKNCDCVIENKEYCKALQEAKCQTIVKTLNLCETPCMHHLIYKEGIFNSFFFMLANIMQMIWHLSV